MGRERDGRWSLGELAMGSAAMRGQGILAAMESSKGEDEH
jgi:hypothetical protein